MLCLQNIWHQQDWLASYWYHVMWILIWFLGFSHERDIDKLFSLLIATSTATSPCPHWRVGWIYEPVPSSSPPLPKHRRLSRRTPGDLGKQSVAQYRHRTCGSGTRHRRLSLYHAVEGFPLWQTTQYKPVQEIFKANFVLSFIYLQ